MQQRQPILRLLGSCPPKAKRRGGCSHATGADLRRSAAKAADTHEKQLSALRSNPSKKVVLPVRGRVRWENCSPGEKKVLGALLLVASRGFFRTGGLASPSPALGRRPRTLLVEQEARGRWGGKGNLRFSTTDSTRRLLQAGLRNRCEPTSVHFLPSCSD